MVTGLIANNIGLANYASWHRQVKTSVQNTARERGSNAPTSSGTNGRGRTDTSSFVGMVDLTLCFLSLVKQLGGDLVLRAAGVYIRAGDTEDVQA
jgi:hypothetical protein